MKLKEWYQKRGPRFIWERGRSLIGRYGFSSDKAVKRILSSLKGMEDLGCPPTFFVPAKVVKRNLKVIRTLQDHGCEIGVHGYDHVDLKDFPTNDACDQLLCAAQFLRNSGLDVNGFRCPYLSATDEIIRTLPKEVFHYSSNKAIQWPYDASGQLNPGLLFDTIRGFYVPVSSQNTLSVPWMMGELLEIPVCIPDDLQLHDGLGFRDEQITEFWKGVLLQTHQRGELFNLMFHPELMASFDGMFSAILKLAQSLAPAVWMTRLCDISTWWEEKAAFRAEVHIKSDKVLINLHCSDRATILVKGLSVKTPLAPGNQDQSHRQRSDETPYLSEGLVTPWYQDYSRVWTKEILIDQSVLPFIGLTEDTPRWIGSSLRRMGYITFTDEHAMPCSLLIDAQQAGKYENPLDLIQKIETLQIPLLRFWPWPNGARSAFCLSGDLDALSLMDYWLRL